MNKFEIFAADALALMGCQALEETIARRSTIAVSGEASASLGLLGRYREAMPGDCLRRGLRKGPPQLEAMVDISENQTINCLATLFRISKVVTEIP